MPRGYRLDAWTWREETRTRSSRPPAGPGQETEILLCSLAKENEIVEEKFTLSDLIIKLNQTLSQETKDILRQIREMYPAIMLIEIESAFRNSPGGNLTAAKPERRRSLQGNPSSNDSGNPRSHP
jgi:hypothetical protein